MFQKIILIAGSLCILGALILTIAYGITVGNVIAFTAGTTFIILALFYRRFPKWLKSTVNILILTGGLFFCTITGLIIIGGNKNEVTFNEDCVLVFGCGVRGETVLPTLQSRLDKCVEYHLQNPTAPIIVSGGQGSRENISEAEAMKQYLTGKGLHPSLIIMEDQSRNTIQNIAFSKNILDAYYYGRHYSVACITSDYHALRCRQAAKKAGYDAYFYPAGVKWYLRPSAYCREVLSICKFWIFD